ncbi:hypothetical protein BD410DRAFT_794716 [Rickenella mellea]|uniref:Uncharacterized protein n=1 Tax=Rickenella mellea TaxID=50990 RepID=A0A4Y7PNJ9_9AGAM|nr:hypothetical protein BD410DRAFT_794716 [Rickenella mellea]
MDLRVDIFSALIIDLCVSLVFLFHKFYIELKSFFSGTTSLDHLCDIGERGYCMASAHPLNIPLRHCYRVIISSAPISTGLSMHGAQKLKTLRGLRWNSSIDPNALRGLFSE